MLPDTLASGDVQNEPPPPKHCQMPAVRRQLADVWTCPLPTTLTSFRATPEELKPPLKACLRPLRKKPPLIFDEPPFSY